MSENVNHPSHYNLGRFEVIEIIEDQQPDFHLGNALKYICRAGKKDPTKTIEDLEKAVWYVKRKIEVLTAARDGRTVTRPNDMNERKVGAHPSLGAPYGAEALAGDKMLPTCATCFHPKDRHFEGGCVVEVGDDLCPCAIQGAV